MTLADEREAPRERREEGRERGEGREEGGYRGRRPRGGPGYRGGPGGRRGRGCAFCKKGAKEVNYKDYDDLRRYLTERGKIKPRRKNATCAKHQRRLAVAIKRARHLALLPFATEGSRG